MNPTSSPTLPGPADRSQPRTITHVVAAYPPHLGGMEAVAQAMAREQRDQGHRVRVLTTNMGAKDAPSVESDDGVEVRRFPAWVVAHTPLSPGLLRAVASIPPDEVVHVHVAQALVLELAWLRSRLHRRHAGYVAHLHLDIGASGPLGRLLPAYKRSLLAPLLRRADALITLTDDMASLARDRYLVPAERVHVVPNGVGQQFVELGRCARSGDGGPLKLLFAGRLAAQKNLPRLLAALGQVQQPVHTRIVGDGDQRAAATRLAADFELTNVEFLGVKRGAEYVEQLAWADAFVLPSDAEGMPIALLEAMAAGLPVVATDVVGTREVLGDAGLLVPTSPESLAAGIDRLAADADLRARLSRSAHERVVGYQWPAIVRTVTAIYDTTDLEEVPR